MPKGCKILFPLIKKNLNLGDITQEGEGKAEYLIIVKERLVLKFTPYLPYESFFSSEEDLLNFIMGIFREGGGGKDTYTLPLIRFIRGICSTARRASCSCSFALRAIAKRK